MTTQQKGLLDAFTQAGWELEAIEQLHEWWADDVWHMRSIWSPQGREFYLTFLVDPQLHLHRERRNGEGVWAVKASSDLPKSSEKAEGQCLLSLGRRWQERLTGFISEVSKFRHAPMAEPIDRE